MALMSCDLMCQGIQQAKEVAIDEFGPKALLVKYEWFKDASAQLDKKNADIKVFEVRLKEIKNQFKDKEIPRHIYEQYMIWHSEVAGIKASYNSLAAEYNSQMAKFNWQFCNAGTLPQGATEVLPREHKPYITE